MPAFRLVDQTGAPLDRDSLEGYTLVLTFFDGRSPDPHLCPTVLGRLGEVQRRLRPDLWDRVRLIALTVDPEHDTPEVLLPLADELGADPRRWSFATGSAGETDRLAAAGGVATWERSDGTVAHTLATLVIDGGKLVDRFPGVTGWSTDDLIAAVVPHAER